jgi:hypothetical protein
MVLRLLSSLLLISFIPAPLNNFSAGTNLIITDAISPPAPKAIHKSHYNGSKPH